MSWHLVSQIVRRGTDPQNVYLSCTKGDPTRPRWGKCGFVLGINFQLVEIDLNRRLSRIVRNLASPNIIVIVLWNMMVRLNMNYYTCYGYYCMLSNDIPHVWHRIVANLKMDNYN